MDEEIKYTNKKNDEVHQFRCIKPERYIINKEISDTLDEIRIIEKKLDELRSFFKNAKEWKFVQFTSIFGIMASYITFMSTYSFAIDDSTRVAVLLLSLFSGCVATFVPAIGGLYFLPNKVEQFLIKHFDYIKNTNIKIQELSKELEQKNDYLLKLNIKLYSLVTGKEITDMEYKKKQVYAFRKTFCDNSVLTNFIDDKGNKKVKRRVRVPKDN